MVSLFDGCINALAKDNEKEVKQAGTIDENIAHYILTTYPASVQSVFTLTLFGALRACWFMKNHKIRSSQQILWSQLHVLLSSIDTGRPFTHFTNIFRMLLLKMIVGTHKELLTHRSSTTPVIHLRTNRFLSTVELQL